MVEVPPVIGPVAVTVTAAMETVVATIMAMEAAIAIAAVKRRRGAEAATMEAAETAAMETTAVKSTAVETTAMKSAAAVTAATAMPNLGRHGIGRRFCRGHGARARHRQRFGALLRGDRQCQDRGRRNTETAQQPAPQSALPHL